MPLSSRSLVFLLLFGPEDESTSILRSVAMCDLVERADENFLRLAGIEPQSYISWTVSRTDYVIPALRLP